MSIEAALLDSGQLDALRSLQEPGEPNVLVMVFEEFRQESRHQMLQFRQALAASDAHALHQTAHSLKSGGAALGATDLAAICAQIEADCKGGTMPADIAWQVARAEAEYARVLQALDEAARA